MKLGFVVNPVAGMGGEVALKGTDDVAEEARDRGAEPRAGDRACRTLRHLRQLDVPVDLVVAADDMGEEAAIEAGFEPRVVDAGGEIYDTTAEDTRDAVRAMVDGDVEVVVFVGGDGTAADVAEAIDSVDADAPALGVPAGVKVYSPVFAESPEDAADVAASFERTETRDVVDVDEETVRGGDVDLTVTGVLTVPVDPRMQQRKSEAAGDVEGLAAGFAADIDEDTTYVLGPGGTMAEVKRALGFEPTALGVDVWRDGDVVVRDATAEEIHDALSEHNVVAVSPIGGQGFVLGRGNQQITPEVVRRSKLQVLASEDKLRSLDALKVDTLDPALDEALRGWTKVRVGRHEYEIETVE